MRENREALQTPTNDGVGRSKKAKKGVNNKVLVNPRF